MTDFSKLFLFTVLGLVVLVLVFPPPARQLASSPLDSDATIGPDASQTTDDESLITRGPGWANVASNGYGPQSMPLALMMPRTGGAPVLSGGGSDDT